MLDEANDLLMSGGVRAFQFTKLGDIARGRIVADPKVEDCYKMKWDATQKRWERTDELDKWPSGETKRQIVLTIQTDEHADQDDDGKRTLYIHSRVQPALRDAVRTAGASGIALGGTIAVRWSSGAGTQDGGPKVYECAYQPPSIDPGALLPGANGNQAAAQTAPASPSQASLLTAPTGPQKPPNVPQEKWDSLSDAQKDAVAAAMSSLAGMGEPPF